MESYPQVYVVILSKLKYIYWHACEETCALQFEEQLWLCTVDGYIYCIFIFEAQTCFVAIRTYIVTVSAGKYIHCCHGPDAFIVGEEVYLDQIPSR